MLSLNGHRQYFSHLTQGPPTFFTPQTGYGLEKNLADGEGWGGGVVDGVFKTGLFIYTVISTLK